METHHMAHKIAEMASGIGVVADVADPLFSEHISADLKDSFANIIWNPGIDPVGNDEVKSSESFQVRVAEIHRLESHVAQSEVCRQRLTPGNGDSRQVNTDEFTFRQLKSHRHQIVGCATA